MKPPSLSFDPIPLKTVFQKLWQLFILVCREAAFFVVQRISPGGMLDPRSPSQIWQKKVTQKDFGGFRLFRIIARFSKHDFWNLGEIWDRNR